MIFSRKTALKDAISGIIEKDNIHPRKYGISSDRKIKDDKKDSNDSLYYYGDLYRSALIYCFLMKKTGNLIYRTEI